MGLPQPEENCLDTTIFAFGFHVPGISGVPDFFREEIHQQAR